jgi:hypothetical protein
MNLTRRFEVGPILVALAALVLLVSLFLDWYGVLAAWEAFEVVDVLLAALAIAAVVAAVGLLAPGAAYVEGRWVPAIVLAIAVLVIAAILDPPPAAEDMTIETGAWLAFGAALAMAAGAILSFGRISFAVSVEGREPRERVAVVDHRQDTTDQPPVPAGPEGDPTQRTLLKDPAEEPTRRTED